MITVLTSGAASAETLIDADYREIYDELRARGSLDAFVRTVHSQYSKAWWSKYERGELTLTYLARQELRRAVSLPALPPLVADVMAEHLSPDVTIYLIGEDTAGVVDRSIWVREGVTEPLIFQLNGNLQIVSADPAPKALVTGVTRPRKPASRRAIHLDRATWERLAAARRDSGATWAAFLTQLLEQNSHRMKNPTADTVGAVAGGPTTAD